VQGDSIHIPLYIFDATIHAKVLGDQQLEGVWVKNYAEDYVVPFEASAGDAPRFEQSGETPSSDFDGKWEVDFISEDGVDKAIGIFDQDGSRVTGTFLTPTGDYRFLEGVAEGNTMKISCFDGTHAFYFEASMTEEGTLRGDFWSGKSWHQPWTAMRNESFELPDPYSMTFIKEGYDTFEFSFPNTSGELVSLDDERYQNKPVVVQILGTWCPNCMDETRFYVDWYARNKDRGVEIVGLAFERKADRDYAIRRIENMKEKLGVEYEVLIAGTTDSASRAQALPMLSKIMSFPTSIILDKQHQVRKIHTGFSGPGTGVYYEKFVDEFELMMDKLILE
jgi:thiol-disulfide isomerase/thioredoxin